MTKNNNESGAIALQSILKNPTTDIEREFVEAFNRYVSVAQNMLFNLMFGTGDADLRDNVFVDYLVDYTNALGMDNAEERINQLEEEYQLTTVEGSAKFNADSFTAKEAGDEALVNTVLERCGLEFNSTSISRIKEAFEATKKYTEGSPAFLNEFASREDLCQKFIDFEQQFNARLSSRKSKNK